MRSENVKSKQVTAHKHAYNITRKKKKKKTTTTTTKKKKPIESILSDERSKKHELAYKKGTLWLSGFWFFK